MVQAANFRLATLLPPEPYWAPERKPKRTVALRPIRTRPKSMAPCVPRAPQRAVSTNERVEWQAMLDCYWLKTPLVPSVAPSTRYAVSRLNGSCGPGRLLLYRVALSTLRHKRSATFIVREDFGKFRMLLLKTSFFFYELLLSHGRANVVLVPTGSMTIILK